MNGKKLTIDDLPELPLEAFERAGKLVPARIGPGLTVRPTRPQEPVQPAPPTAEAAGRSQTCARKYMVVVTYPVVVCYPITDLPDEVVLSPGPTQGCSDIEATARRELYFKLSYHDGVKLAAPSLCRVKHGPWFAVVVEQESCTFGVPNKWTLFIGGIPEPVEFSWYGAWDDMPSFPNLSVMTGTLSLMSEGCSCCPGYHWCPTTGSCIPSQIECRDPVPV